MVDAMRAEFRDGMAAINSRLDRLVSVEVYSLQSAHTDQRITAQSQDIQKLRDAYDALEESFHAYQRDERDRRERDRQARLYQLIVPGLLALLATAVSIWSVVS
ncbi:hypothetical protein [Streptomyces sp. DH12]|uniref:hypothetical protein n=1 Tax=Streptomyces sp. DH12 TaxID=2857010 RepID=UPI001E377010|nr:hypothetical protein [Streptomyces sp. DH12]